MNGHGLQASRKRLVGRGDFRVPPAPEEHSVRGGASAHRRLRGSDKRPRVDWQGYFKPTMCSFWQFAWMSRLAEMALQCVGMRTSSPGA